MARRAARSLRLKIFDPPIALPDISVVMIWNERSQFDRAHRWFRECVSAAGESLA
jgi:DNA-binding transcriptional LysR family regulator